MWADNLIILRRVLFLLQIERLSCVCKSIIFLLACLRPYQDWVYTELEICSEFTSPPLQRCNYSELSVIIFVLNNASNTIRIAKSVRTCRNIQLSFCQLNNRGYLEILDHKCGLQNYVCIILLRAKAQLHITFNTIQVTVRLERSRSDYVHVAACIGVLLESRHP